MQYINVSVRQSALFSRRGAGNGILQYCTVQSSPNFFQVVESYKKYFEPTIYFLTSTMLGSNRRVLNVPKNKFYSLRVNLLGFKATACQAAFFKPLDIFYKRNAIKCQQDYLL